MNMWEDNAELTLPKQDPEAYASLARKILAVMAEVGQLEKDRTIKDRSGKDMYDYLSEEATTGALQRAFISVGLVMIPHKVVEHEQFYVENENKYDKTITKSPITYVRMRYRIMDPDTGAFDFVEGIGYGSDSGDKASNKAMTNAFKYVQRQTFAISTGAEDEADHTSSDGQGTSTPKAVQGSRKPTQSERLVRQLTEGIEAPSAPQKPMLEQLKDAWKEISPTHDLTGFDDWYLKMVEKKTKDTAMLAALQKRKQPAS